MKTHSFIFTLQIQWSLLFILPFISCKQQPPEIEWQQVYGGNEDDFLISILETPDGGYLLGGRSGSGINADRTDYNRGIWEDYWFVKTDAQGNKEWDKALGGNYLDHLSQMKQTQDGGYIITGLSQSGISGDKSEDNIGSSDAWIIKTDAALNKQWDRTLGTKGHEGLYSVQPLSDGSFVFTGASTGDINNPGSKQEIMPYDFWVVATDQSGNILNEVSYGGNLRDHCFSIEQNPDSGFLIAGISESDIGRDVTKPCKGGLDYWVVKTDSNWVKQWDGRYGGSGIDWLSQICKTQDGGYILAGYSNSDKESEKSQTSRGGTDYWLIKIDSAGKKLWDKTYGGNGDDFLCSIVKTQDGGFILGGASLSEKSGEKSTATLSGSDIWIVRTDANGNQLWDLGLGGYGDDGRHPAGGRYVSVIETKDGGYIVGGYSNSGLSGNKTKPGRGGGDYWVIKLKPEKKKKWLW